MPFASFQLSILHDKFGRTDFTFLSYELNKLLEHIENNPQDSKRLIGLTFEQFKSLIEAAEKLDGQKQEEIAVTKSCDDSGTG